MHQVIFPMIYLHFHPTVLTASLAFPPSLTHINGPKLNAKKKKKKKSPEKENLPNCQRGDASGITLPFVNLSVTQGGPECFTIKKLFSLVLCGQLIGLRFIDCCTAEHVLWAPPFKKVLYALLYSFARFAWYRICIKFLTYCSPPPLLSPPFCCQPAPAFPQRTIHKLPLLSCQDTASKPRYLKPDLTARGIP